MISLVRAENNCAMIFISKAHHSNNSLNALSMAQGSQNAKGILHKIHTQTLTLLFLVFSRTEFSKTKDCQIPILIPTSHLPIRISAPDFPHYLFPLLLD